MGERSRWVIPLDTYIGWSSVSVWVRGVFRKTVVGDWHFNYLSGSHLQSQVKSHRQVMVFMPLVLVWIGLVCQDMIGRQNIKVAMTGRLLFYCYFQSVYCLLRTVSFVWGREGGREGERETMTEWKGRRRGVCKRPGPSPLVLQQGLGKHDGKPCLQNVVGLGHVLHQTPPRNSKTKKSFERPHSNKLSLKLQSQHLGASGSATTVCFTQKYQFLFRALFKDKIRFSRASK